MLLSSDAEEKRDAGIVIDASIDQVIPLATRWSLNLLAAVPATRWTIL